MPTKSAKVFFPNLDGLRTIAFLLVFCSHASFFNLLDTGEVMHRLNRSITNGGTGVSVFFVLSGFLITYLLLTETELKGKVNVGYFYLRRALRIWPLYYAVVLFELFLYPLLKEGLGISTHLAHQPFYYLTFLANFDVINIHKYFPGQDAMMLGVTWSVAVEEQFYLVWPLLFVLTPKRFYGWIFPLVITGCLAFRYFHQTDIATLSFHSLSVCGDMAVGGLLAYYCLYSDRLKAFFHHVPKTVIILTYLAGLAWMYYGYELPVAEKSLIYRFISTLFFAFVIGEQNYSYHSFYKFSSSSILTNLGKYTYGLYLLHPIALTIVDISFRAASISYKGNAVLVIVAGVVALGLSLLLSIVSYKYYETPFLKLKERFSFIHRKEIKKKRAKAVAEPL